MGDELKRLDNPNLLAIFVGLTLGVLIGAIPIAIPGMSTPIKLGIAGGPIIVGILMGAFGPRFHLTTYTTQSANLMMRQFGIVIYLAGLGIDSGAHFFETVFRAEGLLWIGPWFPIDDRTGLDRRVHRLSILQARLRPQHRYAMRKHGQSDGLELCQYDRRG